MLRCADARTDGWQPSWTQGAGRSHPGEVASEWADSSYDPDTSARAPRRFDPGRAQPHQSGGLQAWDDGARSLEAIAVYGGGCSRTWDVLPPSAHRPGRGGPSVPAIEWRSDDRARRRRPLPGLRRAGRSAHGPGRPEALARRNTRTYVNRLVRELGADRLFAELDHEDLTAVLGRLVPERNGKPTGAKPTRKFLSTYALALKGT